MINTNITRIINIKRSKRKSKVKEKKGKVK